MLAGSYRLAKAEIASTPFGGSGSHPAAVAGLLDSPVFEPLASPAADLLVGADPRQCASPPQRAPARQLPGWPMSPTMLEKYALAAGEPLERSAALSPHVSASFLSSSTPPRPSGGHTGAPSGRLSADIDLLISSPLSAEIDLLTSNSGDRLFSSPAAESVPPSSVRLRSWNLFGGSDGEDDLAEKSSLDSGILHPSASCQALAYEDQLHLQMQKRLEEPFGAGLVKAELKSAYREVGLLEQAPSAAAQLREQPDEPEKERATERAWRLHQEKLPRNRSDTATGFLIDSGLLKPRGRRRRGRSQISVSSSYRHRSSKTPADLCKQSAPTPVKHVKAAAWSFCRPGSAKLASATADHGAGFSGSTYVVQNAVVRRCARYDGEAATFLPPLEELSHFHTFSNGCS